MNLKKFSLYANTSCIYHNLLKHLIKTRNLVMSSFPYGRSEEAIKSCKIYKKNTLFFKKEKNNNFCHKKVLLTRLLTVSVYLWTERTDQPRMSVQLPKSEWQTHDQLKHLQRLWLKLKLTVKSKTHEEDVRQSWWQYKRSLSSYSLLEVPDDAKPK